MSIQIRKQVNYFPTIFIFYYRSQITVSDILDSTLYMWGTLVTGNFSKAATTISIFSTTSNTKA